jgi:DNA-binding response OmpR family regulator
MMFGMVHEQGAPSVLIIDDERTFADTLAKRLSMREIDCAVAYDGRSGLKLAQDPSLTAVVLDLRLPDIEGAEVLRRIASFNRRLPVIILTGHGTDEDERQCKTIGAAAFLHKPVDLNRLVRLLARYRQGEP